MSRLNILSWTTSTAIHVGLIAVLASVCAAPVELAEIAGNRSVISSAVAPSPAIEVTLESAKKQALPAEPVEVTEVTQTKTAELPVLQPADALLPRTETTMAAIDPRHVVRVDTAELLSTASKVEPPRVQPRAVVPRLDVPPRVAELPRRRPSPVAPAPLVEQVAELSESSSASTPQTIGTTQTVPARPQYNPRPDYPAPAVRQRFQGLVVLRLTISADGLVAAIDVARSSGYSILDVAAADAVREWRFQPASRGGEPIEWNARLPVRFRLN